MARSQELPLLSHVLLKTGSPSGFNRGDSRTSTGAFQLRKFCGYVVTLFSHNDLMGRRSSASRRFLSQSLPAPHALAWPPPSHPCSTGRWLALISALGHGREHRPCPGLLLARTSHPVAQGLEPTASHTLGSSLRPQACGQTCSHQASESPSILRSPRDSAVARRAVPPRR